MLGIQSLSDDVLISIGLLDKGQFNNAAELFADNNHIKNSRVDMVRYGDNTKGACHQHINIQTVKSLYAIINCIK
ncbi:MAG: hypothetical protein PWP62_1944 [Eubacteriaceae bacterium]|nr:hypothetical protein [Eubacteriaceae bacterium]